MSSCCIQIFVLTLFIGFCLSVLLQVSAKANFVDAVQVRSCFVSPMSDPKKAPFWTVISNGCSSNPSLSIGAKIKEEKNKDGKNEEEIAETGGWEKGRDDHTEIKGTRMDTDTQRVSGKETRFLRFSFILHPAFNNSVQFLHLSVLLCLSNSTKGRLMKEAEKNDCQTRIRIPALVTRSVRQQVTSLKH